MFEKGIRWNERSVLINSKRTWLLLSLSVFVHLLEPTFNLCGEQCAITVRCALAFFFSSSFVPVWHFICANRRTERKRKGKNEEKKSGERDTKIFSTTIRFCKQWTVTAIFQCIKIELRNSIASNIEGVNMVWVWVNALLLATSWKIDGKWLRW